MRLVIGFVIAAIAAVGLVLPNSRAPQPLPEGATRESLFAVCGIEQGSGRSTEVAVSSTGEGDVSLTLFANGTDAGSLTTGLGRSGSVVVPVVDVAAVGTVGGLVEMPVAGSGVGVRVTGAASFSAESCAVETPPQTAIAGGTTASQESFTLHLINPFAGQAVVALTVFSENGVESNDRFESVIMPSRSSTILDFLDLAPGRELLSVTIDTIEGRAVAVGRQTNGGELATWPAVEPATDWLVPVPAGDSRGVVISNPFNSEIQYQVDLYGPEGIEEAYDSGSLAGGGQTVFGLTDISSDALGVRIISTAPVVASLRSRGDASLAETVGAPEPATRWLLPGATPPEGGWSTVVLMNAGLDDATATIRSLGRSSSSKTVTVEAGHVFEAGLERGDGQLIESSVPIVALWTAQQGEAVSYSLGAPLRDG